MHNVTGNYSIAETAWSNLYQAIGLLGAAFAGGVLAFFRRRAADKREKDIEKKEE